MTRWDPLALGGAVVGLVAAVVSVAVLPDTVEAALVPVLFAVIGALGPLWAAARFTCRCLVGLGAAHLVAILLSVAAATLPGAAWWHAVALVGYTAGFAVLVPLAAGYPVGPAPRWTWIVAGAFCVLPIAAAFAGPTPSLVTGPGLPDQVAPIATVLPGFVAPAASAIFLLPVIAVAVAIVRAVRSGREVRGRLALPFAALAALAVTVVVGVLLPGSAIDTALFLVAAPLLPIACVAGSRPVRVEPDPVREAATRQASVDLPALTPRERDVLALMAEGQSNPAIGRTLHISVSAVEKHATAIFTKLGLVPEADTHRRVAAVVAYLRAARI